MTWNNVFKVDLVSRKTQHKSCIDYKKNVGKRLGQVLVYICIATWLKMSVVVMISSFVGSFFTVHVWLQRITSIAQIPVGSSRHVTSRHDTTRNVRSWVVSSLSNSTTRHARLDTIRHHKSVTWRAKWNVGLLTRGSTERALKYDYFITVRTAKWNWNKSVSKQSWNSFETAFSVFHVVVQTVLAVVQAHVSLAAHPPLTIIPSSALVAMPPKCVTKSHWII